jgi:hypothetical protein
LGTIVLEIGIHRLTVSTPSEVSVSRVGKVLKESGSGVVESVIPVKTHDKESQGNRIPPSA